MKCYDTLFSKDGLLTNIGSYILLIIIVLHLISIIIFYKCGYAILDNNIQDIIDEKKQLKKMENKLINNEKQNKLEVRGEITKIEIYDLKTNSKRYVNVE